MAQLRTNTGQWMPLRFKLDIPWLEFNDNRVKRDTTQFYESREKTYLLLSAELPYTDISNQNLWLVIKSFSCWRAGLRHKYSRTWSDNFLETSGIFLRCQASEGLRECCEISQNLKGKWSLEMCKNSIVISHPPVLIRVPGLGMDNQPSV